MEFGIYKKSDNPTEIDAGVDRDRGFETRWPFTPDDQNSPTQDVFTSADASFIAEKLESALQSSAWRVQPVDAKTVTCWKKGVERWGSHGRWEWREINMWVWANWDLSPKWFFVLFIGGKMASRQIWEYHGVPYFRQIHLVGHFRARSQILPSPFLQFLEACGAGEAPTFNTPPKVLESLF